MKKYIAELIYCVNVKSGLKVPDAFVQGFSSRVHLKIIRPGIATLKYFRIFNRWGTNVFETINVKSCWEQALITNRRQWACIYTQ